MILNAFSLEGKVAVVTGCDTGLGQGMALGLAEAGCDIVGINIVEPTETIERVTALGRRFLSLTADLRQIDGIPALLERAVAEFGHIDILVNNAGQGRVSTFASTDDVAWTEELHLKFFSVLHPTRAFLPQLESAAHPAIVCVNSLLASQPEPHMVATSAARAGLKNLVRSMATEFAPRGVRVNGILVGLIDSGQWRRRFEAREDKSQDWAAWSADLARRKSIPLGRLGSPDEAARAIVYLATPLSSYTTGSHIDVSGGLSRQA